MNMLPMNNGSRERILIVEDNADTQLLLEHLLRRDYDIVISDAVSDAITTATSDPFDLLLLDINLGEELTGIDVLERVRSMPHHASIPAIAMTAYAMPGDRERFLDLGFSAYLSKPFTRTLLLSCVERVLQNNERLKKC
jgi:CheY-like chemotaxis protein